MAYWLTSASIARQAAALTSAGAGKSGIPCARFTAPYFAASIDMPRITLSVDPAALCERKAKGMSQGAQLRGRERSDQGGSKDVARSQGGPTDRQAGVPPRARWPEAGGAGGDVPRPVLDQPVSADAPAAQQRLQGEPAGAAKLAHSPPLQPEW